MALVLYSDSDSDDTQRPALTAQTLKRKRPDSDTDAHRNALPPLPATFHDLYASSARVGTSDDPTLHGGRKRAVPHVEGNWPSHVYLEWVPSRAESDRLLRLIDSVREALQHANHDRTKPLPVPDITPSLQSPLGAPLPLHISLSRTLQIKTDDRDAFTDALKSSLRRSAVKPFTIQFASLKWVPNYERNRWFLVLGIAKPAHDELNRLLDACNDAAEKTGHPALYTGGKGDGPVADNTPNGVAKRRKSSGAGECVDRSDNFHISIAWNLIEPDPEWIKLVGGIDAKAQMTAPDAPFDAVKAKIGNTVHSLPLSGRTLSLGKRGGILGLG